MSERERAIARRVEDALGGRTICSECQATLATYPTRCRAVGAQLARRCEGFNTVEPVRAPVAREINRLFPPDQ